MLTDLKTITASITRPADTTAYADGDVVTGSTAAALDFNLAAYNPGMGGWFLRADVLSSAYVAVAPEFDLWLFDTTLTPAADNAAFAPTDAEMATRLAVLPVTIAQPGTKTAGAGGNQWISSDDVRVPFVAAPTSMHVYGVLVARTAYVPISGEVFTIDLTVERER